MSKPNIAVIGILMREKSLSRHIVHSTASEIGGETTMMMMMMMVLFLSD